MTLRIVTWNIQRGGSARRGVIAGVLRDVDADVVVLQEATRPDVVGWLAGELGAPHVVVAPHRSVAMLARLPLDDVRWHALPTGRSFVEACVPTASVRIIGVHLTAGLSGTGERRRAREMAALLAVVDDHPGLAQTLIAGDLNAIAPSDSPAVSSLPLWIRLLLRADGGIGKAVVQRCLDHGFVDAFRRFHPSDAGATLPAARPSVRLDYFLLGPDLAGRAVRCDLAGLDARLLARASDHLPLILDLDLPRAGSSPPDAMGPQRLPGDRYA